MGPDTLCSAVHRPLTTGTTRAAVIRILNTFGASSGLSNTSCAELNQMYLCLWRAVWSKYVLCIGSNCQLSLGAVSSGGQGMHTTDLTLTLLHTVHCALYTVHCALYTPWRSTRTLPGRSLLSKRRKATLNESAQTHQRWTALCEGTLCWFSPQSDYKRRKYFKNFMYAIKQCARCTALIFTKLYVLH